MIMNLILSVREQVLTKIFFVDSAINCWCSGGAVEDAFKIKTLVILSFRRRPSINLGSEMNVKTLFTFVNPDFDATEQRR